MSLEQELLSALSALNISTQTPDLPQTTNQTLPTTPTIRNMPIVPDFDTKNLSIVPEYDGNPNELYNFIQVTTLLLNHYWNAADAGCFQNHILTQGIISKLKGRAKEVVSIYGCSDWPSIKDVLIQNFADQRNENSLTRDLVNLRQGFNEAPHQFYEKVMGLLNTISNYVELHNNDDAIKKSKKSFFQQQALTTFLAGLKEPLGSTIRAMRPKDLVHAMQYIQEENNIRYLQKGPSIPLLPLNKTIHQPQRQSAPHSAPTFNPNQWQPFGPRQPFQQQHPLPWQPPQAFRPPTQQPQAFRPPTQQSFGPTQPFRPRPVIQPPRFQPNQTFNRSNVWNNGPGPSQLPKPTPMSITSTGVSQNKIPPNFRPPQQSTPKFTFEELFNIEQQDEASGYTSYGYPDDSWNYYQTEQQDPYQQEEEFKYDGEDSNFHESTGTAEET